MMVGASQWVNQQLSEEHPNENESISIKQFQSTAILATKFVAEKTACGFGLTATP